MSNHPFIAAMVAALMAAVAVLWFRSRRPPPVTQVDLASEVREAREALRAALEALPSQLDRARTFRATIDDAETSPETAERVHWLGDLDSDLQEVKLLDSQLPAADSDYGQLSAMELDVRLLEILALSVRANSLADKYRIAQVPEDWSDAAGDARQPLPLTASL
jgi:hypothetical protein